MSPDNYATHPFVVRHKQAVTGFAQAFPNLSAYFLSRSSDFRGLTMFLGDTAEFVVGLRAFNSDGAPVIMWSSGEDPLMAFINLDKQVASGSFRIDKKALASSPPPPPTDT